MAMSTTASRSFNSMLPSRSDGIVKVMLVLKIIRKPPLWQLRARHEPRLLQRKAHEPVRLRRALAKPCEIATGAPALIHLKSFANGRPGLGCSSTFGTERSQATVAVYAVLSGFFRPTRP